MENSEYIAALLKLVSKGGLTSTITKMPPELYIASANSPETSNLIIKCSIITFFGVVGILSITCPIFALYRKALKPTSDVLDKINDIAEKGENIVHEIKSIADKTNEIAVKAQLMLNQVGNMGQNLNPLNPVKAQLMLNQVGNMGQNLNPLNHWAKVSDYLAKSSKESLLERLKVVFQKRPDGVENIDDYKKLLDTIGTKNPYRDLGDEMHQKLANLAMIADAQVPLDDFRTSSTDSTVIIKLRTTGSGPFDLSGSPSSSSEIHYSDWCFPEGLCFFFIQIGFILIGLLYSYRCVIIVLMSKKRS